MNRIVTDGSVVDRIAALPDHALRLYAEVLGVLQLVPENGRPYNAERPDRPMRELMFGETGEGTVTYLLLEREREVHVLLVQWVG